MKNRIKGGLWGGMKRAVKKGLLQEVLNFLFDRYKNKNIDDLNADIDQIINTFYIVLDAKEFFNLIRIQFLKSEQPEEALNFLENEHARYIFELFLTMAMAKNKRKDVEPDVIINVLTFVSKKLEVSGWLSRLYYEKMKGLKDPIEKLEALQKAADFLHKGLKVMKELKDKRLVYTEALVVKIEKIREKLGVEYKPWRESFPKKEEKLTLLKAETLLLQADDLIKKLCEAQKKSSKNIKYLSQQRELLNGGTKLKPKGKNDKKDDDTILIDIKAPKPVSARNFSLTGRDVQ